MALINSQSIVEDGLITSRTSLAATSNTFTNSGKEFIYINNGSGSSITVTVDVVVSEVENNLYGILSKSNSVLTVEAGVVAMIGTFPVTSYNADDSLVTFTVSSYTSIEAAILYIG